VPDLAQGAINHILILSPAICHAIRRGPCAAVPTRAWGIRHVIVRDHVHNLERVPVHRSRSREGLLCVEHLLARRQQR
jgi:hypothetical protein